MKRILVFADHFEPGFRAGGPIRTLKNIFQALNDDYEFYVITKDHDFGETVPYDLPKLNWIERGTYSIFYVPDGKLHYKTMKDQILALNPDLIYCNSFFSYHFTIQIIVRGAAWKDKIIIAPRGELAEGALKFKTLKKKIYLFFSNLISLHKNMLFHASSEQEAEEIGSKVKCRKILVAPDIVGASELKMKQNYFKKEESLRLCFISRLTNPKNVGYAIELISFLKHLNISLDIFGPVEDEAYWSKCKKSIAELGLREQVTYKGLLKPEEVEKTFSEYDFFFFPTMSENFGHAIFESLSVGTPVILNNTTFWNKYSDDPSWSFIFELNNKEEVLKILLDCYEMTNATYQKMSNKAFLRATEFANDSSLIEQTKKVFDSVRES